MTFKIAASATLRSFVSLMSVAVLSVSLLSASANAAPTVYTSAADYNNAVADAINTIDTFDGPTSLRRRHDPHRHRHPLGDRQRGA